MSNWMTMCSAPKDGNPILVWAKGIEFDGYETPPGSAANMIVAWWGNSSPEGRGIDDWLCQSIESDTFNGSEWTGSWTEYEWRRIMPLYWMPLPEAPEA